jgi:hypothetical protein
VPELTLGIGGLRASVAHMPEAATLISRRYAGFLESGASEWRIAFCERPGGLAPGAPLVVRATGARRFEASRHDFTAVIDLDAHRAELALAVLDDIALDASVRLLYSTALVASDALMLHAAGIARDGRAYVFPGPSGSGKTTLARLSSDGTLLGDEVCIVRMSEHGPVAFGTPFWGDLGRPGVNAAMPIAGLYFIHHADTHVAEPLEGPAAVAAILTNALLFARDPGLMSAALETAARLADAVPCFRLGFRRDPGFWTTIARD